jgi:sugar/nucleoside kinase (ribokinase family)
MEQLLQEELIAVFTQAQNAGVKTVLDVVTPGPADYLPKLKNLFSHVDVFLPNDLEGQLISGISDPLKQVEYFHKLGAKTAIVTLGNGGAVVVAEGKRLRSGTYSVPLVDASGGGDAFAAGYIYGLLHNMPTEECLKVASALGASCVRTIGTTTGVFRKKECEEFLKGNELKMEKV